MEQVAPDLGRTPLLALVTAQGQFSRQQALMGDNYLIRPFRYLNCLPTLPQRHHPSNRIEPIAMFIPGRLVFGSPGFLPCDSGAVDFLQLSYDWAGLLRVKRRHKFAERSVAKLLNHDSYELVDDGSTPAHFLSEADGVKVGLRGVRQPVTAAALCLVGCASKGWKAYQGKPFQDSAYHGGPQTIPGRVQCAYYDFGGEGVAYHDSDATNHGSGGLNPANGE